MTPAAVDELLTKLEECEKSHDYCADQMRCKREAVAEWLEAHKNDQ